MLFNHLMCNEVLRAWMHVATFLMVFSDVLPGTLGVSTRFLICLDSRYGQTGSMGCERKGPTAYSIAFLVGFIKDLVFFSQNQFETR